MSLIKLAPYLGGSVRFIQKQALNIVQKQHISTTRAAYQNIKHYTPNNLEKRFLVWSGKYKTIEDIPSHVSHEEMERCRNKVRIRLANIMIGLTIVGCCVMIYSGKQAAKRGESLTKQNLDWHQKYNEQTSAAAASKEN